MTVVAAAVMERDGLVLVCRRRPDHPHPLKWEFPGGKVEAGESPQAALARELGEELGIRAETGPEITRYEYAYPGKAAILLIFYAVSAWQGEPRNLIFAEIRWEERGNLPLYDFLEGDRDFVRRLAAGSKIEMDPQ
jgi:8-oxo-dGTP diphosphatase